MASVSILEPGSDGRYGGLCPDGHVYNIEVAGTHNYFANGVLVHNCHHSLADTWVRLFAHFSGAKILGFTATPNRGDEKALGQIYTETGYDMTLADAIRLGWLVPIRNEVIELESLDLSSVRKRSGELAAGDLERVFTDEVLREAIEPAIEMASDRQALIFTATRAHMHAVVKTIQVVAEERGIRLPVAWVDGTTPKDRRDKIMDAFRAREIRWLVNVEVATEGFDAPATEVVVMLRPTLSRALYLQMLGRGTRPLPGVVDGPEAPGDRRAAIRASDKTHVLVLDFAGNGSKHELVSTMDLLGGDYTPVEQAEAREMVERGEADDLLDALDKIRARKDAELEEFRARLGDPIALFGLSTATDRFGHQPTKEQRAVLRPLRLPRDLDRREANTVLTELQRREDADLCLYQQARLLAHLGHPIPPLRQMSRARAASLLRDLAHACWRAPDRWEQPPARID